MEQYLIDEYGVVEDKKWLTKPSDIESYFSEDASDYFDCGQGYYEDETSLICKIADKFYHVTINAEITSSKQEYGDRLYRVESISSVKFREIDKPLPKEKTLVNYSLMLTKDQKRSLEHFIKEYKIERVN
ncbi:hypothetical protein IAQ67_16020 [Paenibacillus peoriae]|uniref:Uncharacterized protein n=1 Tax=Paenibacillus peoriae TaxID=59893 RepID=A0A7H0Y2U2_9BACL|nr:hypothetical protein [Paenibacillus peoriae]QNR65400.1 hypothetical protein IAQ67_16020 [Paenibacillus peoriae]